MAPPQTAFRHTDFAIGSFCERKRKVVRECTLLYQLQVLKDTGRYDAFKLEWHPSYDDKPDHWPVPNHLFWDSDVAKWIEGACYYLQEQSNPEIQSAVEELVSMIKAAQQEDGYLNIHFTVVAPKQRFTNLRDLHELYNAGHLIEGALAHHHFFQNNEFLDVVVRYVDLLCQTFGPGEHQKHGYPGHPEIELALIRLYEVTKDTKHLKLAQYFIEERGNPRGVDGRHYYSVEAEQRNEREHERPAYYPFVRSYWYQQAHQPILEQDTVEGHSVRAMYLLTAVAALQEFVPKQEYRSALERLWTNMTSKKMYLTGGIGAIKQWEGFGGDYFLPLGTDDGGCYSETCAAIGVMMMAERMLQVDLDSKYADIMELCLFNSVLTGMSCDGKAFTYVNQLASSDKDLSKREEWFTCACCPPNVTRTLGMLGGYFWTFHEDEKKSSAAVNVHLYGSATLKFQVGAHEVVLTQRSDWPWDGEVEFTLQSDQVKTGVNLRIPGWASNWTVEPAPEAKPVKGYLHLSPEWLSKNSTFRLRVPFSHRLLRPHPFSNQNVVALARGPIVYCVEDVDNQWVKDHFKSLLFDNEAQIKAENVTDDETKEEYVRLVATGKFRNVQASESCASFDVAISDGVNKLVYVPYYYRANRNGRGQMRVGLYNGI
ncbi:glycoside hydrolase family 127 protein [Myriangium duriaei CBS 260.36]|uniref:Glycoside hydrolase family 127 protein n=1 Tax=Myriangium duriaei CBS 260.36 TaxID=1168546 RepID=A0A9P4MDQ7_9PEZI|nr:glycoside hydrolase family 127 protein [Myriangium duriaei CBS 260.36]